MLANKDSQSIRTTAARATALKNTTEQRCALEPLRGTAKARAADPEAAVSIIVVLLFLAACLLCFLLDTLRDSFSVDGIAKSLPGFSSRDVLCYLI